MIGTAKSKSDKNQADTLLNNYTPIQTPTHTLLTCTKLYIAHFKTRTTCKINKKTKLALNIYVTS